MFFHKFSKVKAPDFPPGLTWVNSEPINLKSLIGKVVLVDFFVSSCVNCHRSLPYIKRWHQTYAKNGLMVIGVHTPEFSFESDELQARSALTALGIKYPTVLDPDFSVWNLYANRFWPCVYLIDSRGNIIYTHPGEGSYAETELAIQGALMAIGQTELPAIGPDNSLGGRVCYPTTPEIYFGYLRGRLGNAEPQLADEESALSFPDHLTSDLPYLAGHWRIGDESVSHLRAAAGWRDGLRLQYRGFSLQSVMRATAGSVKLIVELDGQPLPTDFYGADIRTDSSGRSFTVIKEPRLYWLVDSKVYHSGTLTLRLEEAGLEIYSLTVGGCQEKSL